MRYNMILRKGIKLPIVLLKQGDNRSHNEKIREISKQLQNAKDNVKRALEFFSPNFISINLDWNVSPFKKMVKR